ncbi:MAG: DUF4190 domain-containing protein [Clostridiales Family XIII bacterium]|jgi:uncharacterized membrane protein|nr:DUF4190 domain-containing protein [Clostridiales Family XIII bacterium]
MSEEFNNNQAATGTEAPAPAQEPAPEAGTAPQYQDAQQQPYGAQQPQYAQPQYAPQPAKTPTKAIISLVLGILSLFIPFGGLVCAIIAIVLAKQANREMHTGLATAGFVLGIVGLVLGVIMVIAVIAFGTLAFWAAAPYM